jgi:hypothetical protein
MDNTTMASQYCSFLDSLDTQYLVCDTEGEGFRNTKQLVLQRAREGCFEKPWILFPVCLGRNHWVFIAFLNPTYLLTE